MNQFQPGVFGLFSNYAGYVLLGEEALPLSDLEMSRPTGRYISRVVVQCLNILAKKHSIRMVGNACAPGFLLPRPDANAGIGQFRFPDGTPCGALIINAKGQAETRDAVVFPAEPFMVLRIRNHWRTFDHYLQDMRSKYRARARRALHCSEAIQSATLCGSQIDDVLLARCAALLAGTLREKTIALSPDLAGMLRTFRDAFGADFCLHQYHDANGICGFVSSLRRGDRLMAMHLGYKVEGAKDTHLYQRMMYDLVRDAILHGHCELHMGRTATEIKSTLGAEPVENSFVVFARSLLLRKLTAWYKQFFFTPATYTLRRPFHEEAANLRAERQGTEFLSVSLTA